MQSKSRLRLIVDKTAARARLVQRLRELEADACVARLAALEIGDDEAAAEIWSAARIIERVCTSRF